MKHLDTKTSSCKPKVFLLGQETKYLDIASPAARHARSTCLSWIRKAGQTGIQTMREAKQKETRNLVLLKVSSNDMRVSYAARDPCAAFGPQASLR